MSQCDSANPMSLFQYFAVSAYLYAAVVSTLSLIVAYKAWKGSEEDRRLKEEERKVNNEKWEFVHDQVVRIQEDMYELGLAILNLKHELDINNPSPPVKAISRLPGIFLLRYNNNGVCIGNKKQMTDSDWYRLKIEIMLVRLDKKEAEQFRQKILDENVFNQPENSFFKIRTGTFGK